MRPVSPVRLALAAVFAIGVFAAPAHSETLTLDQALKRALAFAPAISSAVAQGDLGAALAREARAPLYPSLSAGSEYMQAPGYSSAVTNGGLSDALITLDYTAYDFGHRVAQARAALYQSEADRYGIEVARQQIVFDTTIAYYELARARSLEREFHTDSLRLKRYVEVIKALRSSGRAIANDVLRVETASNSVGISLSSAHHNAQRAAAVLGAEMGEFEASDITVDDSGSMPEWPGNDVSHNPVLAGAERGVASAEAALRAAETERYPTFKLALSAGWQGINPPHTFRRNGGASYDGVVSMPLFDGGAISAHIDEARARLNAAKAQVRQIRFELRRQLADAEPRYRDARDQLALLDRAEPVARDNFALDWTRFLGGGSATLLEVLDAFQQYEQLRLARPDQIFAARQAAAQASLALGRDR